MATRWMKSLRCKSNAFDDVVSSQNNRHRSLSHSSSSCKNGVQSLRDVVETTKRSKPAKNPQTPSFRRAAVLSGGEPLFPSLTELPAGHPSRNVVEIIFHTGWEDRSFSGRVEMVFKVQNPTTKLARFEEYREIVKSRERSTGAADGGEDHGRCIADGNEVMRFYCLGAMAGGGACEMGNSAWALHAGKRTSVCTYSCSRVAHEKAGGGRGRRAMLVCRVISGRVFNKLGIQSLLESRVGYDSVSGEKGDDVPISTELIVRNDVEYTEIVEPLKSGTRNEMI